MGQRFSPIPMVVGLKVVLAAVVLYAGCRSVCSTLSCLIQQGLTRCGELPSHPLLSPPFWGVACSLDLTLDEQRIPRFWRCVFSCYTLDYEQRSYREHVHDRESSLGADKLFARRRRTEKRRTPCKRCSPGSLSRC